MGAGSALRGAYGSRAAAVRHTAPRLALGRPRASSVSRFPAAGDSAAAKRRFESRMWAAGRRWGTQGRGPHRAALGPDRLAAYADQLLTHAQVLCRQPVVLPRVELHLQSLCGRVVEGWARRGRAGGHEGAQAASPRPTAQRRVAAGCRSVQPHLAGSSTAHLAPQQHPDGRGVHQLPRHRAPLPAGLRGPCQQPGGGCKH